MTSKPSAIDPMPEDAVRKLIATPYRGEAVETSEVQRAPGRFCERTVGAGRTGSTLLAVHSLLIPKTLHVRRRETALGRICSGRRRRVDAIERAGKRYIARLECRRYDRSRRLREELVRGGGTEKRSDDDRPACLPARTASVRVHRAAPAGALRAPRERCSTRDEVRAMSAASSTRSCAICRLTPVNRD